MFQIRFILCKYLVAFIAISISHESMLFANNLCSSIFNSNTIFKPLIDTKVSKTFYADPARSQELGLVLISIRRHQVLFESAVDDIRVEIVLDFFRDLAKQERLPDSDILVSIRDSLHQRDLVDTDVPILAFASDSESVRLGRVMLIPDFEAMQNHSSLFKKMDAEAKKTPWEQKKEEFFWRGSSTGYGNSPIKENNMDELPRARLVRYSQLNPDLIDAGFTQYVQFKSVEVQQKFANKYPLVKWISPESSLSYRYLIDIDGNSSNYTRMAWSLYSGSVLVKYKSDQLQWYYEELKADEHYIAIDDLSELASLTQRYPDAKLKQISMNAKIFAKKVFSKDAMKLYVEKLLQSHAQPPTEYLEIKEALAKSPMPPKSEVDLVAKHNRDHGVYLSLTTSPKRLNKVKNVLTSFPPSQYRQILLNLPEKFGRDQSTYNKSDIRKLTQQFPKLVINRFSTDLGPLSKITPAMQRILDPEAIVISIDDDHGYPAGMIVEIASKVILTNAVVGGSGQNIDFWGIDTNGWPQKEVQLVPSIRSGHLVPVDVIEGFGAIGYKKKFVDVRLMNSLANLSLDCFLSDDLVISYVLALHDIPRYRLDSPYHNLGLVRGFPYGYQEDALHRGGGSGNTYEGDHYNEVKYRSAAKVLKESRNDLKKSVYYVMGLRKVLLSFLPLFPMSYPYMWCVVDF